MRCNASKIASRPAILLVGSLLALTLAACALVGSSAELPRATGFRILPPSTWRETDRGESDRAFRLVSGSIATVTSSCKKTTAPLDVLTRQLLIGSRNVQYLRRDSLRIDGAEALHSSVKVTEDGTPLRLEIIVVRKGGCVFDFSLVNAKEITETDRGEFLHFARSLRYGAD